MTIKDFIRKTLNCLHLDITKNLEYDRLTKDIMKSLLKKDSCCIDVGCHKGEILDYMIKKSSKGKHYAFEPIPVFLENLKKRYKNNPNIKLYPYALSEQEKKSSFNFVKNAPAYSGIKNRRYDIENPEIEVIEVEQNLLDNIISKEKKIDFVKIDVEGAEFGVLKGGKALFKQQKPTILFECGLGGSDYYGTTAEGIYDFITEEIGLEIYTLKKFLSNSKALTTKEFKQLFDTNKEYYFVAHNNKH